jgi:hypothetical protein
MLAADPKEHQHLVGSKRVVTNMLKSTMTQQCVGGSYDDDDDTEGHNKQRILERWYDMRGAK